MVSDESDLRPCSYQLTVRPTSPVLLTKTRPTRSIDLLDCLIKQRLAFADLKFENKLRPKSPNVFKSFALPYITHELPLS